MKNEIEMLGDSIGLLHKMKAEIIRLDLQLTIWRTTALVIAAFSSVLIWLLIHAR